AAHADLRRFDLHADVLLVFDACTALGRPVLARLSGGQCEIVRIGVQIAFHVTLAPLPGPVGDGGQYFGTFRIGLGLCLALGFGFATFLLNLRIRLGLGLRLRFRFWYFRLRLWFRFWLGFRFRLGLGCCLRRLRFRRCCCDHG